MNKNELGILLINVGKFLTKLSEEDYQKFINGEFEIPIKKNNKIAKEKIPEISDERIVIITEEIKSLFDRDSAKEYLEKCVDLKSKNNLTKFAKYNNIYVSKDDKTETLINKIIEFLIGSKLKTDAIQEINFRK